jgi:oligopeptide/dipeptide ABC transporter ATP-binding protein
MLLTVRNATKVFGRSRRAKSEATVALDAISFAIERGETLGIVGESGSGKSTLGRVIVALEFLDSGRIDFDGTEITGLRGDALRRARQGFQVIFQDPYSSLDRRMKISEILTEPLAIHKHGEPSSHPAAVVSMLERVGLQPSVGEAYPHELSGGQRQRVAIARALMLSPKLIVADEPTSALDVSIQANVLNLLQDLQSELGLSYVFISHDLSVVRYMSNRIGVVHRGRMVELGDAEGVYSSPAHPYTRELLDATEGKAISAATAVDIEVTGRTGCLYRARCQFADEVCATVTPIFRAVAPGREVACHHPLIGAEEASA